MARILARAAALAALWGLLGCGGDGSGAGIDPDQDTISDADEGTGDTDDDGFPDRLDLDIPDDAGGEEEE